MLNNSFLPLYILVTLASLSLSKATCTEDELIESIALHCTMMYPNKTICYNENFTKEALRHRYALKEIAENCEKIGYSKMRFLRKTLMKAICCRSSVCAQRCNPDLFNDPFVRYFPDSVPLILELGGKDIFIGLSRKQIYRLKNGNLRHFSDELIDELKIRIIEHLDMLNKHFALLYGKGVDPLGLM